LVTNITKILVKNLPCWQKIYLWLLCAIFRFIRIKINNLTNDNKTIEIAMLSICKQNLATENTPQPIKN
jgi:hypothetical protein